MSFYTSPADIFSARTDRFRTDSNRHCALETSGQEDCHFEKTKYRYGQVTVNRKKQRKSANKV